MEETEGLVIDTGSRVTKCGFSGSDLPRATLPTVVGSPKNLGIMIGFGKNERYVDGDIWSKKGALNLNFPIKNGIVENWNDLQKIYFDVFSNKLARAPEHHPVLLTCPILNPKKEREKHLAVMFEIYKVPACYIAFQPILNVFSSGCTTGCFLEVGAGVSQCICVYEGYGLFHTSVRNNFGGNEIDMNLAFEINKREKLKVSKKYGSKKVLFERSTELEAVKHIKEYLCYVTIDFKKELEEKKNEKMKYYLCDGSEIFIEQKTLFKSSELLFKPSLIDLKMDGIHKMVVKSIEKCASKKIKKELYKNIFVSGGSSLLPGFEERLGNEIQKIMTNEKVKVKSIPNKENSSWIGGSILSNMSNFQKMWITKNDFEKYGSSIVYKRCFM